MELDMIVKGLSQTTSDDKDECVGQMSHIIQNIVHKVTADCSDKEAWKLSVRDLDTTIFQSHRFSLTESLSSKEHASSTEVTDTTTAEDLLYSMELSCAEIAARTMLYSRNPHLISLIKCADCGYFSSLIEQMLMTGEGERAIEHRVTKCHGTEITAIKDTVDATRNEALQNLEQSYYPHQRASLESLVSLIQEDNPRAVNQLCLLVRRSYDAVRASLHALRNPSHAAFCKELNSLRRNLHKTRNRVMKHAFKRSRKYKLRPLKCSAPFTFYPAPETSQDVDKVVQSLMETENVALRDAVLPPEALKDPDSGRLVHLQVREMIMEFLKWLYSVDSISRLHVDESETAAEDGDDGAPTGKLHAQSAAAGVDGVVMQEVRWLKLLARKFDVNQGKDADLTGALQPQDDFHDEEEEIDKSLARDVVALNEGMTLCVDEREEDHPGAPTLDDILQANLERPDKSEEEKLAKELEVLQAIRANIMRTVSGEMEDEPGEAERQILACNLDDDGFNAEDIDLSLMEVVEEWDPDAPRPHEDEVEEEKMESCDNVPEDPIDLIVKESVRNFTALLHQVKASPVPALGKDTDNIKDLSQLQKLGEQVDHEASKYLDNVETVMSTLLCHFDSQPTTSMNEEPAVSSLPDRLASSQRHDVTMSKGDSLFGEFSPTLMSFVRRMFPHPEVVKIPPPAPPAPPPPPPTEVAKMPAPLEVVIDSQGVTPRQISPNLHYFHPQKEKVGIDQVQVNRLRSMLLAYKVDAEEKMQKDQQQCAESSGESTITASGTSQEPQQQQQTPLSSPQSSMTATARILELARMHLGLQKRPDDASDPLRASSSVWQGRRVHVLHGEEDSMARQVSAYMQQCSATMVDPTQILLEPKIPTYILIHARWNILAPRSDDDHDDGEMDLPTNSGNPCSHVDWVRLKNCAMVHMRSYNTVEDVQRDILKEVFPHGRTCVVPDLTTLAHAHPEDLKELLDFFTREKTLDRLWHFRVHPMVLRRLREYKQQSSPAKLSLVERILSLLDESQPSSVHYASVIGHSGKPALSLPGIRDPEQPTLGGLDLMSPSLLAPMLKFMLLLQTETQEQFRHFCLLTEVPLSEAVLREYSRRGITIMTLTALMETKLRHSARRIQGIVSDPRLQQDRFRDSALSVVEDMIQMSHRL